jgi:hypothetical protein
MSSQTRGSTRAAFFVDYAGIMLVITGVLQVMEGIATLFQNTIFSPTVDYIFDLDPTIWGWVHIVVGILLGAAGFYLFYGKLWARIVGIAAAFLGALSNFLYIPFYPVWSVLIIALDLLVIWALIFHGRQVAEARGLD